MGKSFTSGVWRRQSRRLSLAFLKFIHINLGVQVNLTTSLMLETEKIITMSYPVGETEWSPAYDEYYGWCVYKSHPLAEWKDGELLVKGRLVRTDEWEKDILNGRIPVWLVARDLNGGFICGVDLMEDGRIWSGSDREIYENPGDVWALIEEYNRSERSHRTPDSAEFFLCLEEPLQM
jgi:hypothetical protein